MNRPEVTLAENWEFFDSIFCISIQERSDRREQAREEFARVGLLDRVDFLVVEKHRQNRERGIYDSHMECLKRGLDRGSQRILIFEDDVFFRNFSSENLKNSCKNLKKIAAWDAFFLGGISSSSRRISQENLAEIDFRCLAHAYALNRPFAQRLVTIPWDGTPFDGLLRKRCHRSYALFPMCAFQGVASSDNQTVVIDCLRRLLGGLPFIQKSNEMYQNNKLAFLMAPPVIVIGLLLLFHSLID